MKETEFQDLPISNSLDRYLKNTTREDFSFWGDKIPYIKFPDNLKIKIIPPFAGAVIRFRAADLEEKASVSVYLDCYDTLGCYGKPYWEIYPVDGDIFRCDMEDVNTLINTIDKALKQQIEDNNKQ